MNRDEFIAYILSQGCQIVREANQGYLVVRSVVSGKKSGVPVNNPLKPATVCRICKNLDIHIPEIDGLEEVNRVIELAQRNHGNN